MFYEMNQSFYYDIYNVSYETETGTHWVTPMNMVSIVLYVLTFVLGIPGNAFVMWIARFKMKRTVNTIWFLNLAIADFLCCLCIPFVVAEIPLEGHWPFGEVLCKVIPSVVICNMFASVFTLTLISVDRSVQVIKPVWSQNHRTISLASFLCGFTWILAVIICLPAMIYRETSLDKNNVIIMCKYTFNGNESNVRTIFLTRFAVGFLIPLFIIVTCYVLIMRKITSPRFTRSLKAQKIIIAVVVSFFVCWLPYHAVGLMLEYGGTALLTLAQSLDSFSISLVYINSCLNPLLYVFIGQNFKEKIRLSLRHVLERAFSEAPTCSTVSSKRDQSQNTYTSEARS